MGFILVGQSVYLWERNTQMLVNFFRAAPFYRPWERASSQTIFTVRGSLQSSLGSFLMFFSAIKEADLILASGVVSWFRPNLRPHALSSFQKFPSESLSRVPPLLSASPFAFLPPHSPSFSPTFPHILYCSPLRLSPSLPPLFSNFLVLSSLLLALGWEEVTELILGLWGIQRWKSFSCNPFFITSPAIILRVLQVAWFDDKLKNIISSEGTFDLRQPSRPVFIYFCVFTWINQVNSFSCVCWSVGVFRPQTVLMCWGSVGFQVSSGRRWEFSESFAVCATRLKPVPYIKQFVFDPMAWE